ncbi:MAG TPA: DNA polymerase IV [Sedimentisphaerales bacterium]|nr:DNA polymerase IV [Sedimentisphaerales bacterium]HRS09733.1 DNA polymerase IV [Sedimentisphaerales bacterium]HRV46617.1 DNA polymerase IV [Sedimentisphaerales bacterium]
MHAHMNRVRQIIHVDMDAFYASVEQRDRPELRGKAVIVAGDPKARGVVSAASYEARRFGIHSAMPTAQALRRCPHAILLPVRMERYAEISHEIQLIFERYTPLVEPISLDEAFLDVTASVNLFGPAERIGRSIKEQIASQTQLTASVGVAPNKFLAKLASDLKKPDGFVVITERNKQEILDPLGVGRIWGVGKVTERALHSRGIRTIADLRATPEAELTTIVGNGAAELLKLARGEDDSEVEAVRQAKSLSSEQTFATDIHDTTILLGVLLEQVEEVAQRLRRRRLKARTVTLKLRYGDFRTVTRSETLGEATNQTQVLWATAERVFRQWQRNASGALRLLGFGVTGLQSQERSQATLFADPQAEKFERLDQVVDAICDRYGRRAVHRGT